jgi:hypothetical protein
MKSRKSSAAEKKIIFVLSCACCLLIFHNNVNSSSSGFFFITQFFLTLATYPIDNLVCFPLTLTFFFRKVFMLFYWFFFSFSLLLFFLLLSIRYKNINNFVGSLFTAWMMLSTRVGLLVVYYIICWLADFGDDLWFDAENLLTNAQQTVWVVVFKLSIKSFNLWNFNDDPINRETIEQQRKELFLVETFVKLGHVHQKTSHKCSNWISACSIIFLFIN